jgi:aspartate racemase
MRMIGLVGGMSWESSVSYYEGLNLQAEKRLGDGHSASCLLHSLDFHEISSRQEDGDWEGVTKILQKAALSLEKGGAEAVAFCSNTVHLAAAEAVRPLHIPFLSIIDAVSAEIPKETTRPLVLGTAYTMQSRLYVDPLTSMGMTPCFPKAGDQRFLNDVIFQDLCRGRVTEEAQQRAAAIVEAADADALILGCTELSMLLPPRQMRLPVIDSTEAHVRLLSSFMFGDV